MTLAELSAVSRRWDHILSDTPSLWSTIHLFDAPKARDAALLRSKPHPLTILCMCSDAERKAGMKGEIKAHISQPFFDALASHMKRIRTLFIDDLRTLQHLRRFFELPAPSLETIQLRRPIGKHIWYYVELNLFHGQAPKLRHLSLDSVSVPWDSPILTGLTSLVLSNIEHPQPRSDRILQILAQCPLLECIEFHQWPYVLSIPDDAQAVVSLPYLQRLRVTKVPLDFLCTIVQSIDAPYCSYIRLRTSRPSVEPIDTTSYGPPFQRSISHFIPSIHDQLLRGGKLYVKVDGITITNDFPPTRAPSIRCTYPKDQSHHQILFRWLYDALQPFQSFTLELVQDFYRSQAFAHPHLELLPPITKLVIDLDTIPTEQIMAFLATPTVEDGVARWPFADLPELQVRMRKGHVRVLPMIKSRYGITEVQVTLGARSVELPRPFKALYLEKVLEPLFQVLTKIIGEGKVVRCDEAGRRQQARDDESEHDELSL